MFVPDFAEFHDDLAKSVLVNRYFWKDEEGHPIEGWHDMCMRVARAVVMAEPEHLRDEYFEKFFDVMYSGTFLPNSPVLMNFGQPGAMGSACFVLPIDDDMGSIFDTLKHTALIHRDGGGTGFNFSRLRPAGARVKTHGKSSGVVSFMSVYNAAGMVIEQGGKRRGANMGMLNIDHPEIIRFIRCKEEDGKLANFNISVAITDRFMEALQKFPDGVMTCFHETTGDCWIDSDGGWHPIQSEPTPRSAVSRRELFDMIVEHAWKNGEPGVFFVDRANERNPVKHLGRIETTNPCVTGDTRVWTIYGPKTFKELAESGTSIPVLTESVTGELCFRMMRSPRITRKSAKLVKVTFSNGYSLRCTENHRLILKSGDDVEASALKVGDRIQSCYRYLANQKGYLRLTNGTDTPLEHHVVAAFKYGRRPDYPNEHCHHIDEDKINNVPENIEILPSRKHNAMNMIGSNNPMYGVWDERNPLFGIAVDGENNPRYRHDVRTEDLIVMRETGATYREIGRAFGISDCTARNRILGVNHTVSSVEFLDEVEDVFNGTVDEFHRYFIVLGDDDAILSKNCGEYAAIPYSSCNLGSINLAQFVTNGNIDYGRLGQVTKLAVRFLDDVIDINTYPIDEINEVTRSTRPVGLGVMGFADMLLKLGIRYGSDTSVKRAEDVMEFIDREAHAASVELATKRGMYPANKSLPQRNCQVTTIAPTGTISMLAGCSSGIEPIFNWGYERRAAGDIVTVKHPMITVDELRDPSLLPKHFVTTKDISVDEHIAIQAAFQRHCDNGVSKTINMQSSASREDVAEAIKKAWESGCNGITVYRDGSRANQVLEEKKAEPETITLPEPIYEDDDVVIPRGMIVDRPAITDGSTGRFRVGCGSLYVTYNHLNGIPCEVFVNASEHGGCAANNKALGMMISLALRAGVSHEDVVRTLKKVACPACRGKKGLDGKSCADAIANAMIQMHPECGYSVEMLDDYHVQDEARLGLEVIEPEPKGDILCPDCSAPLRYESGCVVCARCGYSKCS